MSAAMSKSRRSGSKTAGCSAYSSARSRCRYSRSSSGLLANTLTACWWMASAFVVGYSIGGLFPTFLQKDLQLSPGLFALIVVFFTLQGAFGGGGMHTLYPAYLAERFPTEVRATAAGFVYHQGAIFGGLTLPIITYFAINWHTGFAIPMLVGTVV